jgi:hypothetical protein
MLRVFLMGRNMHEILHHYAEILTDPAHTMVELTFILVVDGLFLGLVWPVVRKAIDKRVKKEHAVLDAEHGVSHD